jgi:hypothetical protein
MKKLLAAGAGSVLALSLVTGVVAWGALTLSAECAADEATFAWTIDLPAGENNYKIEWSFEANFATFTTVDFGTAGEHDFTTPRGGTILYVRWSSDHDTTAQATANAEICGQTAATPTPSPAPEGSVGPGGSTPTPTPESNVQGGTGTPAPEVPDTATSGSGSVGPIPAIGFGLILLASLGILAGANLKATKRARRLP